MRLEGRKALVTGGAGAIGGGICVGLAREGADVAILDIHGGKRADEVVGKIEAAGRKALFVEADMCKSADIQRAINTALGLDE